MIWQSWAEFIAMGGYGPYVWGSFWACAAVVAGELLALRARHRAALHEGRAR
ncbi:MAG: heme exporter protein CcmD [Pseudomonadota bacterium]